MFICSKFTQGSTVQLELQIEFKGDNCNHYFYLVSHKVERGGGGGGGRGCGG